MPSSQLRIIKPGPTIIPPLPHLLLSFQPPPNFPHSGEEFFCYCLLSFCSILVNTLSISFITYNKLLFSFTCHTFVVIISLVAKDKKILDRLENIAKMPVEKKKSFLMLLMLTLEILKQNKHTHLKINNYELTIYFR